MIRDPHPSSFNFRINFGKSKIININIINYRLLSGKYIIYETERKGIEYNSLNNKLIYEGEYKNGERNGNGKEYNYYGKLKYEGEYLIGKKWNGKEYDDYNGKLKYEGEYLNGKKMEKEKNIIIKEI